jgi:hypothetical protein
MLFTYLFETILLPSNGLSVASDIEPEDLPAKGNAKLDEENSTEAAKLVRVQLMQDLLHVGLRNQ